MRIGARLARLERAAGPRAADCPDCGNPVGRDGRAAGPARSVIYQARFADDGREPTPGPEVCSRCGRVLRRVYRVTFDRAG